MGAQETNTADDQPATGWRKFGEQGDTDSAGPQAPARNYSAPAPSQLTLPAGSWIKVRVDQPLSSDRNRTGDTFVATLVQPLVVNGYVIARRGQSIGGRVGEVQKGGKVKGTSSLGFELTEITLVDGQQMPLVTQLISYAGGTSMSRDATAVGTTTGIGAAIGGVAAGGMGAGIGALAGAAASTIGVLSTRGRATEVYPESVVSFRTLAPLTVSTENSEQAFSASAAGRLRTEPVAAAHRSARRCSSTSVLWRYLLRRLAVLLRTWLLLFEILFGLRLSRRLRPRRISRAAPLKSCHRRPFTYPSKPTGHLTKQETRRCAYSAKNSFSVPPLYCWHLG